MGNRLNPKMYFCRLTFPELSPNEVVKSARTLDGKPIIIDRRQLHPAKNRIMSEPISGKVEVVVFIEDEELNNLDEEGKPLYARAHYEVRYSEYFNKWQTFFTHLTISLEPLISSCRIKRITKVEEMPEWLPRTYFH